MGSFKFVGIDGKIKRINQELIKEIKSLLKGKVFHRGIPGYDDERKVWNGMIDKNPTLILKCENIDDVKAAVKFSRENQIKASVRGGGHNVAGNAILENGIVIDLSEMNYVGVDPQKKIAKVEAGATLGDVDEETQKYGLATPLGLVSETGVAGLSLRGGIGHLMRQFGLTCDNVQSFELVTPNGKLRKIDKNNYPDLYWVLRGGSIDIGVITSFTFQLYPIGPEVLFFFQLFPIDRGKKALLFLKDYMKRAPKELGILGFYANIPNEEDIPKIVQGEKVFAFYGLYTGPKENWPKILDSLKEFEEPLIDLGGPTKFVDVQKALDDDYPDGLRYYWKSVYLDKLNEDIINSIHNWGLNRPSSLTTLDIWFMGGKIREIGAQETAFNRRDADCMLGIESNWENPDLDNENIKWTRDVWEDIRQFSKGGSYMNFAGFEENRKELLKDSYRENYKKMIQIKETVDPLNIF